MKDFIKKRSDHSILELQDHRDLDVMQDPYKNRNAGTAMEQSSTVSRLKFPWKRNQLISMY